MLLSGKKLLITGVLTPGSIAYDCARIAQDEGAEVLLTGFGRGMSLTQRSARRLRPTPDVLEVDVNKADDLAALTGELRRRFGHLDGCLHAIAFAPPDTIGGHFMDAPWASVEVSRMSPGAHQMPHTGRAQMGPVTRTIVQKTTPTSAAVTASRSRSCPGKYFPVRK